MINSKWLVPVLAFLVIIESVFIVKKLSENEQSWQVKDSEEKQVDSKEKQSPQAVLNFEGENVLEVGEEQNVKVMITPKQELLLDGTDLWIKYNPDDLEILGVNPTDRFSEVGKTWIEPEKERVLVTLIELDQAVEFSQGREVRLLTLSYRPKKAGETKLELVKKESGGTNVVGLGKEYPFQVDDFNLTIK